VWSQKISTPPPLHTLPKEGYWKFKGGGESQKYEPKLEFPVGWVGGVWGGGWGAGSGRVRRTKNHGRGKVFSGAIEFSGHT